MPLLMILSRFALVALRGKASFVLFLLAFAVSFHNPFFCLGVVEWKGFILSFFAGGVSLGWKHIVNTFLYLLPINTFLVVSHVWIQERSVTAPVSLSCYATRHSKKISVVSPSASVAQ